VVEIIPGPERSVVILNQTIFHPQGGLPPFLPVDHSGSGGVAALSGVEWFLLQILRCKDHVWGGLVAIEEKWLAWMWQ